MFCHTDEDRERVQEFSVDSRIDVVPNGVDTERFTPAGAASKMIDHQGPVVLCVGRLVEGKRPQDAIEAVAGLPEELNAKLYVAGDGSLRPRLGAKADENVVFLRQVPYEKMPAVYRAGDMLVLPSRVEGLPRTILEAMMCGVPVVVSDLEQVSPVLKGGGVTVPVRDVDGFTASIETILNGSSENPRTASVGNFD